MSLGRSNLPTPDSKPLAVLNGSVNPENSNTPWISYNYDAAGRQTGYTKLIIDRQSNQCTDTITRQYDADDRIISGAQTAYSPTNCGLTSQYEQSYD